MAFNAEKFMQGTSAPMSTKRLVCPEGEWRAFVDDGDKAIDFRHFKGKDGKPDSYQGVFLWAITGDQQPNIFLKRDRVLVPQTIWLDMTDDGEDLDLSEGKNVDLGKLRRLFGLNDAAWNPAMFKGKGPAIIKVAHRTDPNDPETQYAEVRRVVPITT